jgi:uncharacterized protein
MSSLRLTGLWRYPVKSLRGTRCNALPVAARGPLADRQWMLVDAQGGFLTQRQLPRMALIDVRLDGDGLALRCGRSALTVARPPIDAPLLEVTVWRDRCLAQAADAEADRWFSGLLGRPCRLVYLPDSQVRAVDPRFARPDDQVGFADGFPFLLISQASLDDLNARLAQPVPMLRFRPNLVVAGCAAFAEDGWRRIRIGEIDFRVAKPCSRCIVPTIDPETAERAAEPLRTLAGYRRRDKQVFFGQNLIHDGLGELREGMPVEVLE